MATLLSFFKTLKKSSQLDKSGAFLSFGKVCSKVLAQRSGHTDLAVTWMIKKGHI